MKHLWTFPPHLHYLIYRYTNKAASVGGALNGMPSVSCLLPHLLVSVQADNLPEQHAAAHSWGSQPRSLMFPLAVEACMESGISSLAAFPEVWLYLASRHKAFASSCVAARHKHLFTGACWGPLP